jgi:hypothetical protein
MNAIPEVLREYPHMRDVDSDYVLSAATAENPSAGIRVLDRASGVPHQLANVNLIVEHCANCAAAPLNAAPRRDDLVAHKIGGDVARRLATGIFFKKS